MKPTVEIVIEDLIEATLCGGVTLREKHLFRESLRNLVRFAKAEQILEIKTSVKSLTGAITTHAHRRQAKVNLLFKECDASTLLQREFEFDRDAQTQSNPSSDQP